MSEAEYKELVLADYDRQADVHTLSPELLSPTPANIKAVVVKFCERGSELTKGDERILQSFVGVKENVAGYHNAFQNGKADPFRQVVKLIEKRSINPNIKYVNLLALVLGFPQRPYHPGLKPIITDPRGTSRPIPRRKLDESSPQIVKPGKKSFNRRVLVLAVALIAAFIGYEVWRHTWGSYGGCMIWDDDRYLRTECKGHPPHIPVYPVNQNVISRLRLIKRKDTLTQYAVGKYFWAKDHGDIQFYTDSGPCPFDTDKRMIRVSAYVLEQHVPRR